MSTSEVKICLTLGGVRALPLSFDKRFCESLYNKARFYPLTDLTEKQTEWMYRLLYKYRAQLLINPTYELYKTHPMCCKKETLVDGENHSK